MKRFGQFAGGLACATLLIAPAYGADLDMQQCAVSGFNGKLEGAGGFIDSQAGDGARGHGAVSLSLPLGCMLGIQIDGSGGVLDNQETGGVGVHLFTRDPSSYLLGLYGEYSAVGSNDIGRIGAEGELYLGPITLSGVAGYEDSDLTSEDFFGAARGAYYFTENFKVHAGVAHFLNVTAGTFGAEWQPEDLNLPLPVSLFVEGAVGDNDHATVFGGFRIYFGGDQKSLQRRHREDDPPDLLNLLKGLIEQGAGPLCPPGQIFFPGEGCLFVDN